MKSFLAIVFSIFSTQALLAGDNGSYLNCLSASGKTHVVVGQYESYDNDIAMLSILGKSIGQMRVDEGVEKVVIGENIISFIELDHDRDNLLTLQFFPQTEKDQKRRITRARVLSGYNPNTMAPLAFTIDLVCKTVYNPI